MRLNHWIYKLPLRLRSLFRRSQVEQDLEDELQFHLERKIEEALAQGHTPEEARRIAVRSMDGIERRKEECRDMWGVNGIENLFRDLRFGLRTLSKSPGFAVVAILTLALGIGANTAIFTVINSVLLEPLPYPNSERIVQVMLRTPQGEQKNMMTIPRFIICRDLTQTFEEIAAYDSRATGVNLTEGDYPEQLKSAHVSADYFSLFGAKFALGRPFSAEEDKPGGPRLVVISEGLWRRRFGGDPTLIRKVILLEGEPFVVTGVVGSRFTADPEVELWVPLAADPNSIVNNHDFRMSGRLRPGITLEMAEDQMKRAEAEFLLRFPNGAPGAFTVEPLHDVAVGDVRPALFMLFGAVSLVLLIACANVANLLLGRANGRTREMAIRSALGASRWRIIGQLLAESLLLSFAGGLLGVSAGFCGLRTLLALNLATKIPRLGAQGSAAALDGRVLVFTLLISALSAILFALLPAFRATRTDMMNAIKESGSRSGHSIRQGRVRSMLVITEMAMAVILLAGATLLIRTFVALRSVDPGFDAQNVLTMEMSIKGKRFEKTAAVSQLIQEAGRRTAKIGGITALATTSSLPLEPNFYLSFNIEGRPEGDPRHPNGAQWRAISARYFDVFRIPKLRGRVFTDQDDYRAPGVAVINEVMARRFWPNEDPVGKRLKIGGEPGTPFYEPARQIVGVVGDVRDRGLSRLPDPIMYVPVEQETDALTALGNKTAMITWVIRTKAEPYSFSADLQRELRIASGGLPVAHIRSMEQVSTESIGRVNFNMTLLSIFASMALLLAAVGIYGVMSSAVQQQTRDISLRIVMGAEASAVRNLVVGQGMRLALVGMGVGVCLSFAITPLMASLLYGVKATDPAVPLLVGLILSGVALLATYIPAHKATRVDPLIALRCE